MRSSWGKKVWLGATAGLIFCVGTGIVRPFLPFSVNREPNETTSRIELRIQPLVDEWRDPIANKTCHPTKTWSRIYSALAAIHRSSQISGRNHSNSRTFRFAGFDTGSAGMVNQGPCSQASKRIVLDRWARGKERDGALFLSLAGCIGTFTSSEVRAALEQLRWARREEQTPAQNSTTRRHSSGWNVSVDEIIRGASFISFPACDCLLVTP